MNRVTVQEVSILADRLEQFKTELLPGDFSDAAVSARVDIGHLVRDLRRGVWLVERALKAIDSSNRWQEDLEAGAIG